MSSKYSANYSELVVKFMPFLLCLCLIVGCAEEVVEIPLQKAEMKNISTVAILTPVTRPDIFVDAVADDQLLIMLFGGPAILPQIMLQAAMIDARKEDSKIFNELTFDTHVGRMLRESLFSKLKRQAPFYVIPPETIEDNIKVYRLQDKQDKSLDDYQTIAKQLGADTIIELDVLSCGIKDPGVLAKPHSLLIAKVVMTRARDKKVLWQTKVGQALPQEKKFGFDYEKYEAEDAKVLKEELDSLSSVLAEQIVEALGFKAQIPTAKLLKAPHL